MDDNLKKIILINNLLILNVLTRDQVQTSYYCLWSPILLITKEWNQLQRYLIRSQFCVEWCIIYAIIIFLWEVGRIASGQQKGPFQKPFGGRNFVDDFLTGFSSITQDRCMLQTWKLAQKILCAVLRRLACNLSGNKQYLKSRFGENGHFSCILGIFPDFHDLVAAKRGAGPVELAWKASSSRHQMAFFNFHQYSNRWNSFNLNWLIINFIWIFAYLIFLINLIYSLYSLLHI